MSPLAAPSPGATRARLPRVPPPSNPGRENPCGSYLCLTGPAGMEGETGASESRDAPGCSRTLGTEQVAPSKGMNGRGSAQPAPFLGEKDAEIRGIKTR